MKGRSYISRKGNVSLYFLSVFSLVTALISVISLNMKYRLSAMENLIEVHRYLDAENAVIRELECLMRLEEVPEGTYESAGIVFTVSGGGPLYTVNILTGAPEILYIETRDGLVSAYSCLR